MKKIASKLLVGFLFTPCSVAFAQTNLTNCEWSIRVVPDCIDFIQPAITIAGTGPAGEFVGVNLGTTSPNNVEGCEFTTEFYAVALCDFKATFVDDECNWSVTFFKADANSTCPGFVCSPETYFDATAYVASLLFGEAHPEPLQLVVDCAPESCCSECMIDNYCYNYCADLLDQPQLLDIFCQDPPASTDYEDSPYAPELGYLGDPSVTLINTTTDPICEN